ncbi:MAG: hypothetical protein HZC28_05865 [Spirochaetes bacterium]|nr:hypothetical protein [Spirochaetota bacterium]
MRIIHACFIILAGAFCMSAATVADNFRTATLSSELWRVNDGGGTIRIDNGRLRVSAKDESWKRAAMFSKKGFQFWNETGVTLRIRMTALAAAASDGTDISVFAGFTPDAEAKGVQSSENVAGVSITYSRKNGADLALVLKDAQSEDTKRRGDAKGNTFQYLYPAVHIPAAGDDLPLDITLRLDGSVIEVKAGGIEFSQQFPNGLTKRSWENGAYFMLQQMNFSAGRGAVIIDDISINAPAFATAVTLNTRKDPPDKNKYPDQVFVRTEKTIGPDAFSTGGYYNPSMTGMADAPAAWGALVNSMGGILRFPHGLEISFQFWPYETKDWFGVLGAKGGRYGTIQSWFYPNGIKSNPTTVQAMLAAAKAQGVRINLQLNCVSMFNGTDFIYVKTLPEERMKRENPMDVGTFSERALALIVSNNATLIDYVTANGYADTVASIEMDNERWDMPGEDYAAVVAAHVKMIRSKMPAAKIIVCLGELAAYAPDPENTMYVRWSKTLLTRLAALGMTGSIDYFAPHIYPYLSDMAEDFIGNNLEDWAVRNVYRSLDVMSGLIDAAGFKGARFYVSEWGAQSDAVAGGSRNDLISAMASALGTVKTAMAIYSHPRVDAATFHPFIHKSRVSRKEGTPFSKWGGQSVFFMADSGTYRSTPVLEAMLLFRQFSAASTFLPSPMMLPRGVHVIAAEDAKGKKYFVVNSTAASVTFPLAVMKRRTLTATSVEATSVKYGTYGDAPGDITPIVPADYGDGVIPPYSVNMLR